jgi:hypothetical protein
MISGHCSTLVTAPAHGRRTGPDVRARIMRLKDVTKTPYRPLCIGLRWSGRWQIIAEMASFVVRADCLPMPSEMDEQ